MIMDEVHDNLSGRTISHWQRPSQAQPRGPLEEGTPHTRERG